MSNRFLARELDEVRGACRRARASPAALQARGVLPDVAVKMVEVGESTGALQEMLNSVADFYDEEIETEVARFITLIEPVLLVIMGVVIALVVLALYMPLFELSSWWARCGWNPLDDTMEPGAGLIPRRSRTTRQEVRARARRPSATGSSSSTWTSSGSTRSCSGRSRPT
jgi:hypothetical protein